MEIGGRGVDVSKRVSTHTRQVVRVDTLAKCVLSILRSKRRRYQNTRLRNASWRLSVILPFMVVP